MTLHFGRFLLLFVTTLIVGCKGTFTPPPAASPLEAGKRIYQMRCVSCHFSNGSGLAGETRYAGDFTRPNGILKRSDAELLAVIANGYGGNIGRMPAFKPVLTHEDMQHVLGYIRTTFGESKPQPNPEAPVAEPSTEAETTEETP